MADSDKLENAIRAFQQTLMTDFASPIDVLDMFPRGSCKPSSMLLAKYLVDINLATENEIFLSANGMNKDNVSHAWLVVGDLIVDITAFQFDESINNVIFAKNSEFHSHFEGAELFRYDSFMDMAPAYEKDFSKTFKNIMESLA